ncbi:MAG: T9SS type A sorting domain-containing protein [Calditrichales bacterium]|nr:MAG: T9SS type A sorting domain-containing protein [Calditrichales bacterium]
MKKIRLVLFIFMIPFVSQAQYSNADLNGPWFLMFSDTSAQYMIFDGNGVVTEAGFFGLPRPAGDYTVQSDGSFSGSIAADGTLPITGQINSDSTADLFVDFGGQKVKFPMLRVKDVTLCQGTWSGEFISDGSQTPRQITLQIDSSGKVKDGSGLQGPFDGGFYSQSGLLAGHVLTGESDGWYQIHLESGSLADKTMSGRFSIDCSDCPQGDYLLTWQPADIRPSGSVVVSDPVLHENYPNPFNPSTVIGWTMPYAGHAQLSLFDSRGRMVSNFDKGMLRPGYHTMTLDARDLASGVYYYRLLISLSSGPDFSAVKKCLLIR